MASFDESRASSRHANPVSPIFFGLPSCRHVWPATLRSEEVLSPNRSSHASVLTICCITVSRAGKTSSKELGATSSTSGACQIPLRCSTRARSRPADRDHFANAHTGLPRQRRRMNLSRIQVPRAAVGSSAQSLILAFGQTRLPPASAPVSGSARKLSACAHDAIRLRRGGRIIGRTEAEFSQS